MRSIYDFIVKPVGKRYDNEKKVGDKTLITNSSIEAFKSVNNFAEVVATPLAYDTGINVGDVIVIHHNVFRRFYDMKGREKNSRSYFKNNLYFCSVDQIYLYERNNIRKSFLDRCFVKPLVSKKLGDKTIPNKGILKYGNKLLKNLNIVEEDLVGFPNAREWEFVIDEELLYCMKSKDILIKYGHKEDQKEYNPSWAKGY